MISMLTEPLLEDLDGVSWEASTVLSAPTFLKRVERPSVLAREVMPDFVFRDTLKSADEAFGNLCGSEAAVLVQRDAAGAASDHDPSRSQEAIETVSSTKVTWILGSEHGVTKRWVIFLRNHFDLNVVDKLELCHLRCCRWIGRKHVRFVEEDRVKAVVGIVLIGVWGQ